MYNKKYDKNIQALPSAGSRVLRVSIIAPATASAPLVVRMLSMHYVIITFNNFLASC